MTDPTSTLPSGAPAPLVPSLPLVAPRKKSGNASNLVLVLAALVAVGGIAFAGGRATASASSTSGAGSGGNGGNGAFPGGGPGGSFGPTGSFGPGAGLADRTSVITGTVKSVAGTTMRITTSTGAEQTIDLSGSTYHAQASATAADVKAGATVSVSVTGHGGGARPGSSAAPGASAATGASSIKATDVTLTSGQ